MPALSPGIVELIGSTAHEFGFGVTRAISLLHSLGFKSLGLASRNNIITMASQATVPPVPNANNTLPTRNGSSASSNAKPQFKASSGSKAGLENNRRQSGSPVDGPQRYSDATFHCHTPCHCTLYPFPSVVCLFLLQPRAQCMNWQNMVK